jgi:MFS family permease
MDRTSLIPARKPIGAICHHLVSDTKNKLGNNTGNSLHDGVAAASASLPVHLINGSYGATLQAAIIPEMQGRVFAFILSAAMLVSPVALMIAGPFADAFGIQRWFVIAGISCTLMGVFGFFSSDVMGMEDKSRQAAKEIAAKPL